MALINCPKCSTRISSKAAVCTNCQTVLADMNEEQRHNLQQMTKLEKSQKLLNHSMIAMFIFCGGIGSMYWGDPAPDSLQSSLAMGTAVVGFVWYIVNRARIILLKRK
ncbi:hypothetical protein [Thalassotalea crassostreae]|uniref:hypothetical protein n=1 Tax=Thalassotalea crassostreae TaxID=1763536 RepID=UPI00083856E9|nr:hypothetical protein [Thalassotalea crassostreae]